MREKLLKKTTILVFALVLLGMLVSCGGRASSASEAPPADVTEVPTENEESAAPEDPSGETPAPAATEAPTEAPAEVVLSETIADTEGRFSFQFPTGYADIRADVSEEMAGAYSLTVGCYPEESFLFARREPKEGSYVDSVDEYHAHWLELFEEANKEGGTLTNAVVLGGSGAQLDGDERIRKSTAQAVYAEQQLYYVFYTIDGTDTYVQLLCWTTLSKMQSGEALFDKVARTYAEIG